MEKDISSPKRSTCYYWAWTQLVTHGGYLCLIQTPRSKLARFVTRWWWAPLVPIGIALQWIGTVLQLIGWMLRWGRWFHAFWTPDRKTYWSYIPKGKTPDRYFPPIRTFKGKAVVFKAKKNGALPSHKTP